MSGRSDPGHRAADAAIGTSKTALIEQGWKHGRDVRLVDPKAHDDGLRALRDESQAPLAAVRTNLLLHRVRSLVPQRQELRTRDAGPGWFHPG